MKSEIGIKLFSPEENQKADGWLYLLRQNNLYAKVLDNKKPGVYISYEEKIIPPSTKTYFNELEEGYDFGSKTITFMKNDDLVVEVGTHISVQITTDIEGNVIEIILTNMFSTLNYTAKIYSGGEVITIFSRNSLLKLNKSQVLSNFGKIVSINKTAEPEYEEIMEELLKTIFVE